MDNKRFKMCNKKNNSYIYMKTRKLKRKNLKSKSRRKKYGGQPKIQPRPPIRDTPERATVFILMLDDEYKLIKDIATDNGIYTFEIYDTTERMHNLPNINNKAHEMQLTEYWNGISREVGLRLFIFYGTSEAFKQNYFIRKIAEIVASDIKPLVCILLGCSTKYISHTLNKQYNKDSCYFIGTQEKVIHHKYDKTSILCTEYDKGFRYINKLEDIYGAREKYMKDFTTRNCKMLTRDNIVKYLMEIKPITNGPKRDEKGRNIPETGVFNKNASFFPMDSLATISDVSDFKDPDYERKYKEWLDKMLIRHIEYDNGDVYDGYAYWNEEWIKSGPGKMTYSDGTIYEGEWENDEPKR